MKRIYALLLVLMLTTMSLTSCFASTPVSTEQIAAEQLNKLGMFSGTGTGFDLDRQPTRVESAVMLVRMLGVEAEAKTLGATHGFTDVPQWADGYVSYLKKNNLTSGIGSGKFGSTQITTLQQYATFALRSLGYSSTSGDFKYENAIEVAVENGIIKDTKQITSQFDRGEMCVVTLNTLTALHKSTNGTLFETLEVAGNFTEEQKEIFNMVISQNIEFPDTSDNSMESVTTPINNLEAPVESFTPPLLNSATELKTIDGSIVDISARLDTNTFDIMNIKSPVDLQKVTLQLIRNNGFVGAEVVSSSNGAKYAVLASINKSNTFLELISFYEDVNTHLTQLTLVDNNGTLEPLASMQAESYSVSLFDANKTFVGLCFIKDNAQDLIDIPVFANMSSLERIVPRNEYGRQE